jgi:hypothetical protein
MLLDEPSIGLVDLGAARARLQPQGFISGIPSVHRARTLSDAGALSKPVATAAKW